MTVTCSQPPASAWLSRVTTVPDPWHAGATLHLRRAWPRSADHVLLEYATTSPSPHFIVGQWLADQQRLRHVAAATVAAAGPGTAALLASCGVVVHRHGADRRLGVLPRVLDNPAATLVVHRPERRAVVRLDPDPSTGAPRRWVKVVRPDRVATLLARSAHLQSLEGVPHLLEVRAAHGVTVWADLPGVTLADLLGKADATAAMTGTGALLRRLHEQPAPTSPTLLHDAAAEHAVLSTWIRHLAAFDPVTHQLAVALHGGVIELLEEVPAAPVRTVTVHRDVHDGQLLVAASGVNLLDPDTVAAGEPELDLGNLCAHLRLAACQGRGGRADADRLFDVLLDAYGQDNVNSRRLHAYTTAALLRLVGVHALRPATRAALPALLGEIERMLSGNGLLLAR